MYALDTLKEKLEHVRRNLRLLQDEQEEKRNNALAYVLEHQRMIIDEALTQLRHEPKEAKE